MIDHLKHMAVFARVVDEGSFRGAARSLGLAPSRISEIVTELENSLGTTLLYRTTRKIALTNEGRVFYARVVEMVRSAELGLNELNALALDPVGTLRVSVPAFMSSSELLTAMGAFAEQNPNVALSISFSDQPVGLIEDGFDLAIRVGWLDDSSMMSRKLGHIERVLVANSEYVARGPVPKRPSDLENWNWISYAQRSDNIAFRNKAGRIVRVSGKSQIQVDNIDALRHLTAQGLGVTVMPRYLADQALGAGDFTELLPDWRLKPLGLFAVWPDQSRRENLTVLFVRFLAEQLKR